MLMSRIMGHRGCAGHAPENTLAGIRDAVRVGCKWIEADATLLEDGTVVLFHDDTVDRCTNGSGFVQKFTWPELLSLDAGGWYGKGQFVGERVPLLSDALKCCKSLGMGFNIELKIHRGEGVELAKAVSEIITSHDCGELLVSSYNRIALDAVEHDIPKGYICNDLPDDWEDVDCQSVHLWAKHVRPEYVEAVKNSSRDVYVFTVNDKTQAKRIFDMGVDGVFSDYPDRVFLKDE